MINEQRLSNDNIINNADNIINNNGASKCITYRNTDATDDANISVISNESSSTDNLNINIYRFKFLEEFCQDLYEFSKVHQYDERKMFKESWTQWAEDNTNIIDSEVRRLTNLGYEGDILDKMFKSARYYYRKKGTEKKAPQERKVYKSVRKDILDAMDAHILRGLRNSEEFKPSVGFAAFCKEQTDLLKEEVTYLFSNGVTKHEDVQQKIKKTYKNRYFLKITEN